MESNGTHFNRLPSPGPRIAVVLIMDDSAYQDVSELNEEETSVLDWLASRPDECWVWRCERRPGTWPERLYRYLVGQILKRIAGS
jgi:hypothetical protein